MKNTSVVNLSPQGLTRSVVLLSFQNVPKLSTWPYALPPMATRHGFVKRRLLSSAGIMVQTVLVVGGGASGWGISCMKSVCTG